MNTRQTAIALGIIGLLATSITTQAAAPLVWEDNFDSYTSGNDLTGNGWSQMSGYGSAIKVITDPTASGHGIVVNFGSGGVAPNAQITLPTSFASFVDGDTHVLTFDVYRVLNSSNIKLPNIMLGQNETGKFLTPSTVPSGNYVLEGYATAKDFDLTMNSYGAYGTPFYSGGTGDAGELFDMNLNAGGVLAYSGLVLTPGAWHTITETITRSGANVTFSISLDGGSAVNFTKTYDTGYDYLRLATDSSGGSFYVDNIKAYGQEAPVRGTLISIQ